jgi:hypothetical protein
MVSCLLPRSSIYILSRIFLASFIVYEFDEAFPEHWSFLLLTAVERDQLIGILVTLHSVIDGKSRSNPEAVFHFLSEGREELILFLNAIFSTNALCVSGNIHMLEQTRCTLSKLMLNICDFKDLDRKKELEKDDLQELVSLWLYLSEKICFLSNRFFYVTQY